MGTMSTPITECCDCAVIGGGPGGLTAAIYLARFDRKVVVFDTGQPRARYSPRNRNYPGFPEGLTGPEILERFQQQAERFKVRFIREAATGVGQVEDMFCVQVDGRAVQARRVILATGVTDLWPDMDGAADMRGDRIRVCPICDAYETNDHRVGLMGCGDKVAREALYIRHFTRHLTLFTHGLNEKSPICDELVQRLEQAGIDVREAPVTRLVPVGEEGVTLCLEDGQEQEVDLLFSALGARPNADLAVELGAQLDEDGYVCINAKQETTVPGLFAVGDVTSAINQVSVAVGQGAVAATSVHNSLLDF